MAPALSFNTAVSFVSNTSWQAYSGESTLSYFSQMGAILVAQLTIAAVGMAVAIALIRGLAHDVPRSLKIVGKRPNAICGPSCATAQVWRRSSVKVCSARVVG